MVHIRTSTACVVALLLSFNVLGQDNQPNKSDLRAIVSADEAVARAMLYTGFDKQKIVPEGDLSVSTKLIIIQEDFTPFLSDSIIGKSVWKVVVEGVRFDLPDWTWVNTQPSRTFEVLIDSATGRFFGAYSYYSGHDPDMAPEPSADAATKSLRGQRDIFEGFPPEPPPITLAQAMNKAVGSSPIRAKELYCICVVRTHLGKPATTVWSIIGRGTPPFDLHGHDKLRPMYQRNRWRTLVDATTGNPLSIDNQPPAVIFPEEHK